MQEQNSETGAQPVVQVRVDGEQVPNSGPTTGAGSPAISWTDVIFKRHMVYDPLMLLFSLFIMVLAIVGYATKGSVASIVSGTIFFLVLLVATHIEGVRRNSYPLLITLTVLFMFMATRYLKKKEFWPSGLVALASFCMLSRHLYIMLVLRNSA